jgi:hypothetical protein
LSEAPCPSCASPPELFVQGICTRCALSDARQLPKLVGGYPVLGPLGGGGGGRVLRVLEPWSGREVALKVIAAGELATAREQLQFRADLTFLTRLQHPNIVQVYDTSGVHQSVPYYTMQLVEGGALSHESWRAKYREPKHAAQLIATLARAAHFCHSAQPPVLHCDIKPENVLIGHGGHPYLADFGIARSLEASSSSHTKSRVGTARYMSPEQVEGSEVSPASDVYSLGVVLYELLTGVRPHEGGSDHVVMERVLSEPIVPPHKLMPKLDRDLSRICMAALGRRTAQRYASAEDLAEDLERHLRGEVPVLLSPKPSLHALYWTRDNPVVFGVAVVILLLTVLFLGALALVREQEARQRAGVLDSLAEDASEIARLYEYDLTRYAQVLTGIARDLEREVVRPGAAPQYDLSGYLSRFAAPLAVDVLTLFDSKGRVVARSSPEPRVLERSFETRPYYKDGRQLGERGYRAATISPAHEGVPEGVGEIPIVAPTFDGEGKFNGMLLILLRERASFGSASRASSGQPKRREIVVVGPSTEGPRVLVHPHHETRANTRAPALQALLARVTGTASEPERRLERADERVLKFDAHRDPLGDPNDLWLAAAAPVAHTGYAVIVQMRHAEATRESAQLVRRASLYGAGWLAVLLGAIVALLRARRRPSPSR